MKIVIVKKLWLEAIFDNQLAEHLLKEGKEQDIYKSCQWYYMFKNELNRYGIINPVLESYINKHNIERLSNEEINQNIRAFFERVYYEGFIRKNN